MDFDTKNTMPEPQPHPLLVEPTLYITGVPANISDTELAQSFDSCLPVRPTIVRDGRGVDGGGHGKVEFKYLASAEKALATLDGRPIPGTYPPTPLRLSAFPFDQQLPGSIPQPGAAMRVVKQLPPHYGDAQLYDLFRPFGAIQSVRTGTQFGPNSGSIHYWREDEAKRAEEEMHCAEIEDGQSIAVQAYNQRRAGAPTTSEFSPNAPTFVPGAQSFGGTAASPLSPSYRATSPRRVSGPFVHGPGQQVQFAPVAGPGAGSHSGLIDPCNLFIKNIDESIDSISLHQSFSKYGQIVSARVMRDESGKSRGFGFVSFQTADQASLAMHSMNGAMLGMKQIVVRLHEPKQLRQEKLAVRYSGGHNNHPRSRSGATSPTASEGGDSTLAWQSPRSGFQSLASPTGHGDRLTPGHARRSSGSYYNAALTGQLQMNLSYDTLSAMSNGMRREILSGELHRRVKQMDEVPVPDIDAVVHNLLTLSLAEIVDNLHDASRFASAVRTAQRTHSAQTSKSGSEGRSASSNGKKSPSPAASADSRLLDPNVLAATASAPDHPSTPVSHSSPMSTPPRTSSPASATQPGGAASERDRLHAAVSKLESDADKASQITELLMSLSKRERALCLFNNEVLRGKVNDARIVLESDDDEGETVVEPTTPLRKTTAGSFEDSPHTPALSSRAPSAAASPAAPVTPPSKSVSTMLDSLSLGSSLPVASQNAISIDKLAQMPAARAVEILMKDGATCDALGLSRPDPAVVSATNAFVDGLKGFTVTKQKQQLGDKLFRVVKNFGIKGAPKVTIALLDQEELRPLAHLMNSFPPVLKEKAISAQQGLAK